MLPIVTPHEMRAIDAAATTPVATLVERSGAAVARAALRMLGGAYGRRVIVLAGPGNNGNDGRVAATHLRRRGVRVTVIDAAEVPTVQCRRCSKVLNARDAPVVDRSCKGPIAGRLFCSSLCLTLQRSATATGRDDAPAYRGLSAAADEAEAEEDEDEEDELLVLPAGASPEKANAKAQLRKIVTEGEERDDDGGKLISIKTRTSAASK